MDGICAHLRPNKLDEVCLVSVPVLCESGVVVTMTIPFGLVASVLRDNYQPCKVGRVGECVHVVTAH